MSNSNTTVVPIWPSGIARFGDGILEVTTGDGVRGRPATSLRSISNHPAPGVSRCGSGIGRGSTRPGRATGWNPSTRRRLGCSSTPSQQPEARPRRNLASGAPR